MCYNGVMENYHPEYTLTKELFNLSEKITRQIERIHYTGNEKMILKLRKEANIQSISSSLRIEANSLNLDEVTDVINGKKVIGPARDIAEVKAANEAYKHLEDYKVNDYKSMLKAHAYMMEGVNEKVTPGKFRNHGEAVLKNGVPIHVAPPQGMVPILIAQLFDWYKNEDLPIPLKSSIFHYEFEFIHPFGDGNGRTGRLWQTVQLMQETPLFMCIPVETVIAANQQRYYDALQRSTKESDCGIFAEFMMGCILIALENFERDHIEPILRANEALAKIEEKKVKNAQKKESKLLELLRQDPEADYEELARKMRTSPRTIARFLGELKNSYKITRVGSKKTGHWDVNVLPE